MAYVTAFSGFEDRVARIYAAHKAGFRKVRPDTSNGDLSYPDARGTARISAVTHLAMLSLAMLVGGATVLLGRVAYFQLLSGLETRTADLSDPRVMAAGGLSVALILAVALCRAWHLSGPVRSRAVLAGFLAMIFFGEPMLAEQFPVAWSVLYSGTALADLTAIMNAFTGG